jgi:MOSC domain-containing protein YiiM
MAESGKIAAIAVRTAKLGPMKEVGTATVTARGGIDGDLPVRPERGVTLISKEQWAEVTGELRTDLPWHTRRANVLIEGLRLSSLVGKRIRMGEVELLVHGETKGCALMDVLFQGLREALRPDMRAGVHCEVVRGGQFQVGDRVVEVE